MQSKRQPFLDRLVISAVVLAAVTSGGVPQFAPASLAGQSGVQVNADLDQLFAAVAEGVRYEPYRGIARGSAATAAMRSGNSFDQSLLLAERLRQSGYQVRFARGDLEEGNRSVLLRGMYPPRIPSTPVDERYGAFVPGDDPELIGAVSEHVWVEVYQGDDWLPLDPSFPRSVIGERYATARETFAAPTADDYQSLTLTLYEEDSEGMQRELTRVSGRVAELALSPITLTVRVVPVARTPEPEAGGSPSRSMGMFGGAMAGESEPEETPEPAAEEVVGLRLARTLDARGTVTELPAAVVLADDGATPRREWLEIETRIPGEPPVKVERELTRFGPPLAGYRRHTLTVVNGPVRPELVSRLRKEGTELTRLDGREREVRAAARLRPADPSSGAAARRIDRMGGLAGAVSGHLLNLFFARDSDALAAAMTANAGAVLSWGRPRVLISSLTMDEPGAGGAAVLSLDLRVNRVGIHPYPGLPSRLGPLLQTARGLQDAAIEGALVDRAAQGGRPLSAGAVMDAAARQGDPLRVVRRGVDLEGLGLPAAVTRQLRPTLEAGYDVILPERPVEVEGRERWAWLRVDPEGGGLVAVMDGGEHQGMTQYTASGSSIGLNDKMGLAIGAIVGATTTEFMVAGGILKYGGASDEMVAEVEGYISDIMCSTCRSGAGASAAAGVGGASASLGCFEIKKEVTGQAGVSVRVPFCESYKKGFDCAAGLLMGGLKGESLVAEATVSGASWEPPKVSHGCD